MKTKSLLLAFAPVVLASMFSPALAAEYNRRMIADYEEIRDFVILHYCTTQREDTPFWREVKAMEPPASLKRKIELFRVKIGRAHV